jgi:signal transduction histidine kinase
MGGEKYYYGLEKLALVEDEQQRNRIIEEALEAVKKNTAVLKDKYQQNLLSAVIREEQKERERIVNNLHDELGTNLTINKINLLKKAEQLGVNPDFVTDVERVLDITLKAVKDLTKDIISPTLKVFGYVKAVEELAAQAGGEDLEVSYVNKCIQLQLAAGAEVQLFRITKELVNNILKHACASRINIFTARENGKFRLVISHNGKGISSAQARELLSQDKGLGLKSIFSRALALNASVDYLVYEDRAEVVVML